MAACVCVCVCVESVAWPEGRDCNGHPTVKREGAGKEEGERGGGGVLMRWLKECRLTGVCPRALERLTANHTHTHTDSGVECGIFLSQVSLVGDL